MDNIKQFPIKQLQPGQQFQVDLKNATQKVCQNKLYVHTEWGPRGHICGCKHFIPVIAVYTVSALVSPTGQELTVQQPVLVCRECGKELT